MKNKIKLIILIIPLILLSSGCTATYTLNITKDKIEETLDIKETFEQTYKNAYLNEKGNLDGFQNNSTYLNKYVKQMQEKYQKYYLNKDNFNRDNSLRLNNLYENGYIYYLTNNKEYSQKNNSLINNLIKDSLIINDNNIIVHLDNIPTKFIENLDKMSIIITTDLTVTSNNADSVAFSIILAKASDLSYNYANKREEQIAIISRIFMAESSLELDKESNELMSKKDTEKLVSRAKELSSDGEYIRLFDEEENYKELIHNTEIAEAQERASEERALEIAKNLIKMGLNNEQIIDATKISIEEINILRKEV